MYRKLMKILSTVIFTIILVFGLNIGQSFASNSTELKETENTPGYQPKDGIVPDATTAIAIAVAVWTPVYGKGQIASERPYNATLKDGRWTITGSLPKGWAGGVATAVILKKNGQVEKIYHTK